MKRAGEQLCECEADIGGGRAAGSGIGMRGGLGRYARAREVMSAEGARARLQQAEREWLARRGVERELVRCSAELGMPGWLRASEQELRRVLQAEAAAAAEAKATAAEAKAVAEVKARAAAEAEAAKAVTEAAARVANFFAEAKAAEDKAAAEAEAEALAAATAEARALVEAEAEAEAMARATAEAVDAMKAAATAERRERRGLPRAMRGQSGVGEAGGAAQAELRFAVSMAAEAEKQARRLTAQAREAQVILESLEAVARGRYPLRARVEADGRRQGGDRAEHRGRVRKGGSAAAFGGVSQVEEEWRDHRAQDPGREGSVGGAGQAGRCRCQPTSRMDGARGIRGGEARGWGVCLRVFVCMVSDASGGHRLVRLAGLRIHIQLFALRVVPGLLFVRVQLASDVCCQGTPLYERVRGRWFRVRDGALSCAVGVR